MKYLFSFICCFLIFSEAKAQIVINEYSCSNLNGPTDAFGQRTDWIELYNTSATPINLAGYYMSDDKFTPQKWQVPTAISIPANGRIMVFCNERGVVQGGQIHTSFKLTQMKGEYFVLANASGVIVDSVKFIPTQANHSRGRKTDGAAAWGLFDTPNPNAANVNAKDGYAAKPQMSVSPGFYTSAQNVNITTSDPTLQIRYTTDGSVPTATSTLYSTPIVVSNTTVIRAVAFSSNPLIVPSFTETNTYFINVVVAPTMNIISVSGNYNGLFTSWGASQGTNTSFEFFDNNKQFKFEFEGVSKRHGHDSWAYPQKGFRVYVKDEFGYDYAMKYKFFNNSFRDTFQQIILKAAASDNYNGNGGPSCHLRDAFVHTLSLKYNLDVDQRRYSPTVVFVNGQYWGVYEIREKVNGDYTKYYYGQPESKIDLLSYWGGLQVRAGSDTGWNNLYNYIMNNNMAVSANYDHVTNFLDVKSLITYFILNTWLVNTDWLNWNTMWWRGRKGNGVKWRYALWDEDNVLGLGQNYTGMGTVTYENNPCQPFSLFQNNSSIKHTDMLARLMNNPTFDQLYRSTFIDLLNGPLDCAHMIPHFDSMIHIIDPEMQRHINRWGGTYATWQNHLSLMRTQILGRCFVISQKLDSCMNLNPQRLSFNVSPANTGIIAMNGNTVSPYVWSKIVAADTTINLAATPTAPYYLFDHWEKYETMNTFNPDSLTSSVGYTFKKKDSVVAFFKYFNPDSIKVTFNVLPVGKGNIALNGVTMASYPNTITLDRRVTYQLDATSVANYRFFNWKKNRTSTQFTPSAFDNKVNFNFNEGDTIVANFMYDPQTNTLPNSPALPELDQTITMPTAFSPNNDGKNDVFRMVKGKDVKSIDLRIYDRWGTMIFNATSPEEFWDGTFKGQPSEIGTYFYTLTVWFDNAIQNSKKTYKGEVTLIR